MLFPISKNRHSYDVNKGCLLYKTVYKYNISYWKTFSGNSLDVLFYLNVVIFYSKNSLKNIHYRILRGYNWNEHHSCIIFSKYRLQQQLGIQIQIQVLGYSTQIFNSTSNINVLFEKINLSYSKRLMYRILLTGYLTL